MGYNYVVRTGPYDVFGTLASPKTLSASYVADTNATQVYDGFSKCTLEIKFTPGGNGEFAEVLIEASNDYTNGAPTNFFPISEFGYPSATPQSAWVGLNGVPFRAPEDVTTPQAATVYYRSYTVDFNAKYLRFSVRSSAGSNFGTVGLRVFFTE